jgi:L-gulonate 5-dehydrogenase
MQLAAVTTAIRTVNIQRSPTPTRGPQEALLRVETVGICGTDLHIYDGSFPAPLPLVQGHEISGVVEDLPDEYGGPLAVGDRVAVEPVVACGTCHTCRIGRRNTCMAVSAIGVHRAGGLQEVVAVPVANCYKAADLPADAVALCETMSVSLRAVSRPQVSAADTVVVLGAGPIGLGAVLGASSLGAKVMVVDRFELRLKLASELGATELVQDLDELPARVDDWTSGTGASVVIEATGSGVVAARAFDVVGHAGRISIVGVSQDPLPISVRPFTRKEIDVYGSISTLDFAGAVAFTRAHKEEVRRLVSHRFALEQTGEAIAFGHDNPDEVVKVLIEVA